LDGNLNLWNQFIGNIQRGLSSLGACVQSIGRMTFAASANRTVGSNTSVLTKAQGSARQRPEFLYLPQEPLPHVFWGFTHHEVHVS
jgi:hypothetical protein